VNRRRRYGAADWLLPWIFASLGVAGCHVHDNTLGDNGAAPTGTCQRLGQAYAAGARVTLDACTDCFCQPDGTIGMCIDTCTLGRGGTTGTAGQTGTGGATVVTASRLPCDIYAAEGGHCVAAHSTVRALSGVYVGPLYQVRRGDGAIRDIGVLTAGGFADSAAQDAFCADDACSISLIYDQSGRGNHLAKAPPGQAKSTPGNEANAKALSVTIAGHKVYGVHVVPGVGYRNNQPTSTATGDDPETIYMIASGDFYNANCCFDYGNAETNSFDKGEGSVEAVYFGSCSIWNKGAGNGPWVMGDLENGLWAGSSSPYLLNTSLNFNYVTAMVKGDQAGLNHWVIKAGNAAAGALSKMFDGPRPSERYVPMKKEGAVILGTAGDNSNAGQGNFFEGVMTDHFSSEAADDAVQASIVSAYAQ
jgi:non-reducing end alpha-L-arabinofuranosidase